MDYNISVKYTAQWLREHPVDVLQELLLQAQKQALVLREQAAQGGRRMVVARPHLFKKIKKDIARIKTVMGEV